MFHATNIVGTFRTSRKAITGELRIHPSIEGLYVGAVDNLMHMRGTFAFFQQKGKDRYFYLNLDNNDLFYGDDGRFYLSEPVTYTARESIYDIFERVGLKFSRTSENVYRERIN